MSNKSGWDVDFSALIQGYSDRIDEFVKMLGLRILTSVILKSPVDTGRFRGNWHVSFDEPKVKEIDAIDKNGMITIEIGEKVLNRFKAGVTAIYIQNSLPYAMELERGHSKQQAPEGMVRITAIEIQAWIDEIAKELNS